MGAPFRPHIIDEDQPTRGILPPLRYDGLPVIFDAYRIDGRHLDGDPPLPGEGDGSATGILCIEGAGIVDQDLDVDRLSRADLDLESGGSRRDLFTDRAAVGRGFPRLPGNRPEHGEHRGDREPAARPQGNTSVISRR